MRSCKRLVGVEGTHPFTSSLSLVHKRPHVHVNELIDLVNTLLQDLFGLSRDMDVERWIFGCRFAPVRVPNALCAYSCTSIFMNLDGNGFRPCKMITKPTLLA
jgi:hypothetical protein